VSAHFKWLLLAILASLGLIALDLFIPALPAVFAVMPVLPLVAYHLGYLSPRARSIGSAEVDSVYYLGFLITVAALAATAIELALGRNEDLRPVLLKFGLGLLATGYAVVARMHLQSMSSTAEVVSPERAFDDYVKGSNELLLNLDAAVINLKALAENTLAANKAIVEGASRQFEKSVTSTAEAFDSELKSTMESAKQSVIAIRSLLADTTFETERKQFLDLLRQSAAASLDAKSAIEAFAEGARRGTESLGEVHASAVTLTSSAETLTGTLGRLNTEQSSLSGVAANVQAASEASAAAARSAESTSAAVFALSGKVQETTQAFEAASRSAGGTTQQLDALSQASQRLEQAVSTLTAAVATSERFAARIEHVGETLPTLAAHVQSLDGEFDALKGTLSTTAGRLEGDVQRSTRAVTLLADNLAKIAQNIIDQTRRQHAGV
jgi:hypothetical protein